mgnify:CR=1 FL=1
MDLERKVHDPWIELDTDNDFTWCPPAEAAYTGSAGGPPAAPSSQVTQVAQSGSSLSDIFLFMVPRSFF